MRTRSQVIPIDSYQAAVLLDLIASGRLDPEALISRRVDLADGAAHLAGMDCRSDGVVVIEQP